MTHHGQSEDYDAPLTIADYDAPCTMDKVQIMTHHALSTRC